MTVAALWDAIRDEWRDRASNAVAQADPRGSLVEMFHIGRTMIPQVEIVIPVHSPVPLDESRRSTSGARNEEKTRWPTARPSSSG